MGALREFGSTSPVNEADFEDEDYAVELRWEENFELWEDYLYARDLHEAKKQANGTWLLPEGKVLTIVGIRAK